MKYVALLRGINVGGKNKVDMGQLVAAMEQQDFGEVSTYINSGNIFFTSNKSEKQIVTSLEALIKDEFSLEIRVLLRDKPNIDQLASSIPKDWVNGDKMKCDVMFLWEKYNSKSVLEYLSAKPEIDDVRYAKGALLWKVDRENVTKSGMMKLVGTDVYANMTIRNVNTVRKIKERLNSSLPRTAISNR